jgi:hypothetical protein
VTCDTAMGDGVPGSMLGEICGCVDGLEAGLADSIAMDRVGVAGGPWFDWAHPTTTIASAAIPAVRRRLGDMQSGRPYALAGSSGELVSFSACHGITSLVSPVHPIQPRARSGDTYVGSRSG